MEQEISKVHDWIIMFTGVMEKICFSLSDLIVVPTSQIRDFLCEKYGLAPERFLVISNGSDPDTCHPMEQEQCRRKLGLDLDGKYLVFVGSFKKWHGIGEIVNLVPQLIKRIPKLRLLLVGDGDGKLVAEKFVLENGLKDHVIFCGRQDFKEVPVYINAADICLAPYFEVGLNKIGLAPFKIFEYMACGRPVISNSIAGLDDLFQSCKMGLLLESMNPSDWIEPIEALLNDPERMREFGNNGRQAVVDKYNWRTICEDIARHISEL
ncbi:MAG: glycosyltransferase family 4 protein [Nitrospinae bacterium]|nr:glycosyltransferase family 4 protein [Nitrospinota bacterium]